MRKLTEEELKTAVDLVDVCKVFGFQADYQLVKNTLAKNQPENIKKLIETLFYPGNFSDTKIIKIVSAVWNFLFDKISDDGKTPFFQAGNEPQKLSLVEGRPVTITMTTCKRMDLAFRTIDSFLRCVSDIEDFVSEWIVIDDNSSEADRNKLTANYPFIKLVRKTDKDRGHPRSMNIIKQKVKTPFILHLEDDWEFFARGPWIDRMIKIIESQKSYGQCLFNVNYAEDCNVGSTITGAKFQGEPHPHFVHQHHNDPTEVAKHRHNCFYWPHFSFRPGLWKRDILLSVGEFNETAEHFEMEYARRYVSKGWQTAFLPGIFCNHIGRRTYERHDKTKRNAYELNNQAQFDKKTPAQQKQAERKQIHIDTYVINLKRREDRLIDFVKRNNSELPNFKVFQGVDGKEIKPSFAIQKLFETGDFNFRRGIVGCALSHIALWRALTKDTGSDFALIFEDDAKLAPYFTPRLIHLLDTYDGQFDIMFLHWLPYPGQRNVDDYLLTKTPTAKQWTRQESETRSMGGATAYVINRKAAINLLKHIDSHGVYNGIDWVMFKGAEDLRIFYSTPMLAFAECVQSDGRVDSDIQRDFSNCGLRDIDSFEIDWWTKKIGKDNISILPEPDFSKVSVLPIERKNEFEKTKRYVWYKGAKNLFIVPFKFADEEFLSSHPLFDHRYFLDE